MPPRKKRKFRIIAAALFVLGAALAVALPWVYAWAVPHYLRQAGVAVQSLSHHPLRGLSLTGIRYHSATDGIDLRAETIDLPAFYPFLWGAFWADERRSSVRVADWTLTLGTATGDATDKADAPAKTAATLPASGNTTGTTTETAGKTAADTAENATTQALTPAEAVLLARKWLLAARPWLRQATLDNGKIEAEGYVLRLTKVDWLDGAVTVEGFLPEAMPEESTAGANAAAIAQPAAPVAATATPVDETPVPVAPTTAPVDEATAKSVPPQTAVLPDVAVQTSDAAPKASPEDTAVTKDSLEDTAATTPLPEAEATKDSLEGAAAPLPLPDAAAVKAASPEATVAKVATPKPPPEAIPPSHRQEKSPNTAPAGRKAVHTNGFQSASAFATDPKGALIETIRASRAPEPFTLSLAPLPLPAIGLTASATLPERGILAALQASVTDIAKDTLTATLSVQGKGAEAHGQARWGQTGWLPQSASLSTRDFPIPHELIRVPDYTQPQISLSAQWQDGTGSLNLKGFAKSLSAQNPPLQWSLLADADAKGATIRSLHMAGPWLKGDLSEPLRLEWAQFAPKNRSAAAQSGSPVTEQGTAAAAQDGQTVTEQNGGDAAVQGGQTTTEQGGTAAAAQSGQTATEQNGGDAVQRSTTPAATEQNGGGLTQAPGKRPPQEAEPLLRLLLDVDLADFPVIPLEGKAKGALSLETDPQGNLGAELQLSSDTLHWKTTALESFSLRARLRGTLLLLEQFDLRAADNSYLTAIGSIDLARHHIDKSEVKGRVSDRFVREFGTALPQGESAEFVVQVFGAWDNVAHAGQVRVNKIHIASENDTIDAILQWEGKMLDIPEIKLFMQGELLEAQVNAAFRRDAQKQTDTLTFTSARLQSGKYPAVTLEEPSTLTYNEAEKTVQLTPLKLTSDGQGYLHATISLPQGGEPGRISLHAAQISGHWLEIYRNARLPCPVAIESIALDVTWRPDAYLDGTFHLSAYAEPKDLPKIELTAQAGLTEKGLTLSNLSAREGNLQLLKATASLPFAVRLDKDNAATLHEAEGGAIAAQADVALENEELLKWIEETFRLHLGNFKGTLSLSGTSAEPQGDLALDLRSLAWDKPPRNLPPLPRVDALQLRASLTPEMLSIPSLNATFGGVPLFAEAALPLPKAEREKLLRGEGLPLERASARIDSGDIPLSAFGPMLPAMLRQGGSVRIIGQMEPKFEFSGVFTLQDVSTRPLPPIGSIESISAELHLEQEKIEVVQMEAQIGAQPISITGTVNIEDFAKPVYDLKLTGGDLPVVRSPGLILRASPDLTLKTDDNGITTLGGELELGQSFYTLDFSAITVPGSGGALNEQTRPPYFAVTEPPMARWQLNIRLFGDRFLRVRTPVFEGIVSANFNLRGPLLAPVSFGSARLDQGVVLFPFATLRMRDGTLTIRQDDPYAPQIDLVAEGRAYGFDLKMHLTGTATEPNIQFTSSPSLEQSEILLLLTTGQIPNAPERSTMSRLSGLGMFLGNNMLINLGLMDPLDERFELMIGEDVTEKNQDTITIRYRIDDDWSVIGNYDRFDAYNLDLEWTIYRD